MRILELFDRTTDDVESLRFVNDKINEWTQRPEAAVKSVSGGKLLTEVSVHLIRDSILKDLRAEKKRLEQKLLHMVHRCHKDNML